MYPRLLAGNAGADQNFLLFTHRLYRACIIIYSITPGKTSAYKDEPRETRPTVFDTTTGSTSVANL